MYDTFRVRDIVSALAANFPHKQILQTATCRVIHGGRKLNGDDTLKDSGLKEGTRVHVLQVKASTEMEAFREAEAEVSRWKAVRAKREKGEDEKRFRDWKEDRELSRRVEAGWPRVNYSRRE